MRKLIAALLVLISAIAFAQQPVPGVSVSAAVQFTDGFKKERPFDTRIYTRYREHNQMLNYWFSSKFMLGAGFSHTNLYQENQRLGTRSEFSGASGRVEARGVFPVFSDRFLFNVSGAASYSLPKAMRLLRDEAEGGDLMAVARQYSFNAGVSYKTNIGLMFTFSPINLIYYDFRANTPFASDRPNDSAIAMVQQTGVRFNYLCLRVDLFTN